MKERQLERPRTPEEPKKKCLNCGGMEDFIKGLQGEIKRLQVSYFFHNKFSKSNIFLFIGFNKRFTNVTYHGWCYSNCS